MSDYIHTGDYVCFDYSKLFYGGLYLMLFSMFEENSGPFYVAEADPLFNFSELVIDGRRIAVTNDILKKLTWS